MASGNLVVLALIALVGCSSPHRPRDKLGQYKLPTDAKVILGKTVSGQGNIGTKASEPSCLVQLTENDIRAAFATYRLISQAELHNQYLWAPCYIEGQVQMNSRVFFWRARAGNTIETDFPDGQIKILGGEPSDSPEN